MSIENPNIILSDYNGNQVGTQSNNLFVTVSSSSNQNVVLSDYNGTKVGTQSNNLFVSICSSSIQLKLDSLGRLVTVLQDTPKFGGFASGLKTTTTTTITPINKTVYTEQNSNAQRSLVSTSASDSSNGVGIRQVKIVYLDQDGNGQFSETVTLNGTTPVNTVNSNICFIERLEAMTAGSSKVAVGTISLKGSINGGDGTIGSIAVGDVQTFWSHHYTPTGKITYITSVVIGHDGATIPDGKNAYDTWGGFTLKSVPVPTGSFVEKQISGTNFIDWTTHTLIREYSTPVVISGSASRTTMYVLPSVTDSTDFTATIEFYDQ